MREIIFSAFEWIKTHEILIGWIGTLSMLTFAGFLIAIPIIIVKLPRDYFQTHTREKGQKTRKASFSHLVYLAFKNSVGLVLIIAGFAMLFLPGQGLITLIIGLSFLNIPGKRQLIIKILCGHKVLKAMNKLRSKFSKPAFRI